jgi:hypothetical protein
MEKWSRTWEHIEYPSIEDYFIGLKNKVKEDAYRKGWEKFLLTGKLKGTFEIM